MATANGNVTVPDAGNVGASRNVCAVLSTEMVSGLKTPPVQEAGILIVALPERRSTSFLVCVHVLPDSVSAALAPAGAVNEPPVIATFAAMLASPLRPAVPAGPVAP